MAKTWGAAQSSDAGSGSITDLGTLDLPEQVSANLAEQLPEVAERTVAAVIEGVPEYAEAFAEGKVRRTIERAVQTALAAFLRLVSVTDSHTSLSDAIDAAYALGRGEARSGRTVDALLSAYRIGARTAWRSMSSSAVKSGISADTTADFAELVFAYIDQLSAASINGHNDEQATSGRVRQQYLEQLSQALLTGQPVDELSGLAERANWESPRTLTAVILPESRRRSAAASLDPRTLSLPGNAVDGVGADHGVLLVPDSEKSRPLLLRTLTGTGAIVGPSRPWTVVRSSFQRACHATELLPAHGDDVLDTDQHLVELVLNADADSLSDLRHQILAPLRDQRPASAERLEQTLRSWLLHQGRREAVAADLVVHPQTVRYRMTQLRQLFGDQLDDPGSVLALIVALGPTANADQ